MTPNSKAQLSLLDAIQENGRYTQRDLAGSTGLALSYINRLIKDLVKKEWVNVKALNGKRLLYGLTPKGMSEKARLTFKHVLDAVDSYKAVRLRVLNLCDKLKQEGKKRVIFCGVSSEAEIAFLATLEMGIEILKMVDERNNEQRWLKMRVESFEDIAEYPYDHIIVTDIERFEPLVGKLLAAGVDAEDISLCIGHRIKPMTTFQMIDA